MLVDLGLSQVEGQLSASDTADTKATAILATDGVLIALVAASGRDWKQVWPVPIAGAIVSAAFAVAALWPRVFRHGPDLEESYKEMAGQDREGATAQMISELVASKNFNRDIIGGKRALFLASVLALVITLAVSGFAWWIWAK